MSQQSNLSTASLQKPDDTAQMPAATITFFVLRSRVTELERQRTAERAAARHRAHVITVQIRTARRERDEWLRRHFMTTAEAAEALGVSTRLLQALAAEGSVTLPTTDGHVMEIGFRTVFHGGYWFARDDIHRILRAQRARR